MYYVSCYHWCIFIHIIFQPNLNVHTVFTGDVFYYIRCIFTLITIHNAYFHMSQLSLSIMYHITCCILICFLYLLLCALYFVMCLVFLHVLEYNVCIFTPTYYTMYTLFFSEDVFYYVTPRDIPRDVSGSNVIKYDWVFFVLVKSLVKGTWFDQTAWTPCHGASPRLTCTTWRTSEATKD